MKILYLHGFASGPQSKKGVEFDKYFTARGHEVQRLNLRVPSFEHLRLSAMIETVQAAIDGPVVLIGSSLGGLTAARVAERDDRVRACVLLAPAFQLVARWKQQLGAAEWDAWRARGTREVDDYTTGAKSSVDFGFVEDVERVDVGYPDVRVPTLVMHGLRDEVVPVDRARTFATGKPNVRLVELDDGHELVASLPRLLAETEAFLAELAA
jgi:alpha-beta hydrolase superfamily lysophospholipase